MERTTALALLVLVLAVSVSAQTAAPVLSTIGPQTITEGSLLTITVSASDADGTTPVLFTSTGPSGASFTDNLDGTGSFSWTPNYTQAGTYVDTFYAADAVTADTAMEAVTITVTNVNQAPTLASIGSQSVAEGATLSFAVSATDPDGTTPVLTTSSLPTNASFTDNNDGTGSFTFTPDYTQAGSFNVTFYAADDSTSDSEIVAITVSNTNQAPVLAPIGAQSIAEAATLTVNVSASDADGTSPTLTTSLLPTNAAFVDHLNGTGTLTFTPDYSQSGSYDITFYATDGTATDSEVVVVTVTNVNQAPVLAAIGAKATDENQLLTFGVSASDADGTMPTLTTSTLPLGATFTDNGNGTGSFDWTPSYSQSGSFTVTFYALDGSATDSEVVAITVNNVNQVPVLATIGPQSTDEAQALAFGVSASDPDGTTPALTTSSLPIGAAFVDNLNGTGDFTWTPDYSQSGEYNVTFYASDGTAIDSEVVTISVNNVNQAPVLAGIGAKSVAEGGTLSFAISATDADGTALTLTTSTLPANATFVDSLNGAGSFTFNPDFTQAGTFDITFRASDGVAVDSEVVTITVTNVNQLPVLAAIGPMSTDEGQLLSFAVSASDPDGTTPVLTTSALPLNASFIDNGNGTGTFSFTPAYDQSGTHNIVFRASDGIATDSELVTITVNNVNQAPVLAAIGSQSVAEGATLSLEVLASDPDGTTPTLTTSTLPTNATFVDNGNGTGSFTFNPDLTQAGSYNVTFRASDGSAIDSEVVTITVSNANQAPTLAAIANQSIGEGQELSFGVSASDPDGTTPALTTSTLPLNASFIDNGNGTGTFSWTPGFDQAGSYNIVFTASDGSLTDSELVTITVTNVNQAPVLAAIGAKSTDENQLLSFGVSASDPDGGNPVLTTSTLPLGASFTDNGDGTGTFTWTPSYSQSGSYNITFRASDGSAIDSEVVAITVTNVNQAPVLASIGAKSVAEGAVLNFGVSATDGDGTLLTLTTSALPTNATFVDNGNGTGTFDFAPGFDQAGTYNVTFRASDGVAVDSETVAITVTNTNQAPVLAAIGAQTVAEGGTLNVTVTASDADGTIPVLTTSALPANASFVDNNDGTGSFVFSPSFSQSGTNQITFYASDGTAIDSEVVTVTVSNTNQAPVLAAIGPQSTDENQLLTFGVTASDADATTPTLTTSTLPTGATFTDNGNGTGTFDWTPSYSQSGSYNVTFRASDGTAVDSEIVTITVVNINQAPVLATIGAKSVAEGGTLGFDVTASDPDGGTPTLTTSTLPANASFMDNGDGSGTFSFNPDFTQAGSYNITFRASDGSAVDSEVVTVTVTGTNQAPVLAAIGPKSTNENQLLTFAVSASDPDGTTPALTTSTLPTNATFTDNGNGTGTFSFTPSFSQSGSYPVTFRASDGTATDSEVVTITVNNVNQAPVLAAIGAKSVAEGGTLSFDVTATDADGTTPNFTTSSLPTNATFVDNGDGTGSFSFAPDFTQEGSYSVTFRASDGTAIDSETVTITVTGTNQAPMLAAIGAKATDENQALSFGVSATDADGTTPTLTTSTLPTGATFTDNLNGTGSFSWTPSYSQSGSYNITFYASDGTAIDSEVVAVTVNNVNQAPVLAAIGAKSVAEGGTLSFNASASDADGTIPALTTSALPTNATFVDNGDGTGTFTFNPDYAQAGTYNVTFRASDGTAVDSEAVAITVTATNQAPVLAAIGAKSTNENQLLSFGVSASDADGTTPVLTTSALPTGATFTDNNNGTGTFTWTPSYSQSGTYNITFRASDGTAIDSEIVAITVTNLNQSPVLAAIGAKSVAEGASLNFNVSATDPDGTTPSFATSSLPTNATFVDNGDGTGSFSFTPSYSQSGSYNVTFRASDGAAIDSEVVAITVTNTNQAPVLAAIGPKSVVEGANLSFTVSATDADGTTPTLVTSTLPTNASFVDNGDGTGSFVFDPSFTQAGSYNVTFRASDGTALDSEVVAITVTEAGNQTPVLSAIGSKSVTEGASLSFDITATDADGTTPSFTTSSLPTNATFVDNGDGTGTFAFTPSYTQAGTYSVTFRASDGTAIDSEVVAITVTDAGNQAPILAAIGAKSVVEGQTLTVTASASDPDGTTPALTTSTLPTNATFVDNSDGTGTLTFNPSFTQAGTYNVTFRASDGALVDSEVVTITVNEAGNQAPVLAAIGAKATDENQLLTFGVSASDADGTTPTLTTSTLPTGATFTDNHDGTGTFNWTPSYSQSGSYNITFRASDGTAVDSEVVAITVTNVNQPPVLAAIGPKTVAEGGTLSVGVTATDPDGATPALTTSTLPTNANFVDNGNGTGTFTFNPDFTQEGTYSVTFRASDGVAVDSEIVAITVTGTNQAPTLAAIGNKSTNEGQLLSFAVSASDADGTIPALTTSTLPLNASFIDHGDGTGTFDFTPAYNQSGSYNIVFTASDGIATDSELVTITVTNVNQAPVLATIGSKSVAEGASLAFTVNASDPDGTTPALTTSTLPTNATFTDNGNGTGSFTFNPSFAQSGSYNVTFRASDGTLVDSEVVVITVTNTNQAPILAAIGSKSTNEGQLLSFAVSASDPDGTTPSFTTSTLPTNATFTDNGNGTGTFNFTPSFSQSGSYNITFRASDGSLVDSETVTITVNQVNQAPVLAAIGSKSTTEGINLSFTASATDADGTTPALTSSTLPSGATFTDNGNGTGSFSWTPTFNRAGSYSVTFYARDDSSAVDSEVVAITVIESGNHAPILATIGSQSTTEGINLSFAISAADPDSTIPTFTTSTLPTGATFQDNGDGTGNFSWTPSYTQAGSYSVTFRATDGTAIDTEKVTINVFESGNQAPVLAAIGNKSGAEGVNLNFSVSATDPDGTTPVLSAVSLPTGATFTNNGNGTGTFNWTPGFTQAGSYNVTFRATDGVATDSETIAITITESGNQAPVLAAIGSKSITEGATLSFTVSASDPDGTTPTFTTSALPTGATFIDNGNGTGSFAWTPTYTQAGPYSVTFRTSDGSLVDSEVVAITVTDAGNQPPVLANITAKSTTEGINLTFSASATDPDGTTPTLSAGSLPTGATFVDNANGTGTFSWTPSYTQAGGYTIVVRASDGSLVDTQLVSINVLEAGNRAPVIATIGPKSVTEGLTLSVTVNASDPDGTTPVLSSSTLPRGASFIDNGDGTGSFSWTPDFVQSGSYNVNFYATDGILKDTEAVAITVIDAHNQAPVLAAIGSKNATEGILLAVGVSATDAEGNAPDLTTGTLPSGATFTDNNNGTGTFSWTPVYNQAGSYSVTFKATDDSLAVDSEVVNITVADGGNQAPILATVGNRSVAENATLSFGVSAVDADSTIPALTTSTLPTGATFTDNANGSGSFAWTPTFTQAGSYPVTFYASDGVAIDSERITITVTDAGNQAPVLAAIGPRSTTENIRLTFNISGSDPDGTTPSFTTSTLPTGATFADNGNGTGTFDWTPSYVQAGTYNITFRATDGSLVDTELVTITVTEAGNQAPVLAAIGAKSVTEGSVLNFNVSASDVDGTTPSLSASGLPTNASFTDNGNGTGTFNFAPTYVQAGSYNVTFRASDGALIDSEVVAITVTDAGNQAPVLAAIGNKSVEENANLNFGVSASDADGTAPALTTSALPTGATFVDHGDGTATFDWTPGYSQSGSYPVTFYASDGTAIDSERVTITVSEVNLPPVLASIGAKTVAENSSLAFTATASDPDGTTPVLTTSTLPTGATFADNGNGSGSFAWTPNYAQSGSYPVTFYASDGQYVDSEVVTITVTNTNRPPVANAGFDQNGVFVNATVSLDGSASSDPDLQSITFAWTQVSGPAVTLSGSTTATPSFVPPTPATYGFQLVVSDGSLFSTPDTVLVSAINAAPPRAITDLNIAIVSDNISLSWSAITTDTAGVPTTLSGYLIYRDTLAYFTPSSADSIGTTTGLTFTDNNIFGANVVGDTARQYFYTVLSYDIYGNRSAVSNRVGEYDYAIVTTATNSYNLICVPFENTGITTADQLINAIGKSSVRTVNNYRPLSQSFESRFAAGFGTNFAVVPGGVYQVNAAAPTTFSVAGRVPAPGAISYQLITTASTDYTFLSIPFDRESQFFYAQDVLNNVPGGFNTLNRFVATSQSYQSRFAAGFGTNFPVKAGKPYQANNAKNEVFPH